MLCSFTVFYLSIGIGVCVSFFRENEFRWNGLISREWGLRHTWAKDSRNLGCSYCVDKLPVLIWIRIWPKMPSYESAISQKNQKTWIQTRALAQYTYFAILWLKSLLPQVIQSSLLNNDGRLLVCFALLWGHDDESRYALWGRQPVWLSLSLSNSFLKFRKKNRFVIMDAKWINKKRLNILASIHNYTANNIRGSEIGKVFGPASN